MPTVCPTGAMLQTLDARGIRIFDYATQFAQPFRKAIRRRVEQTAAEEGVELEYVEKPKGFRRKTASGRSSPNEAIIRVWSTSSP